jgi:hypothetical protein
MATRVTKHCATYGGNGLMKMRRERIAMRAFWLACCLLLPLFTHADDPARTAVNSQPLRVLMVGGGPDLENNQVAIESNVRYVGKLLPPDTVRTTLFADGDINHATVLYEDDPAKLSVGERLLNLILYGQESDNSSPTHYRKPNLGGKLDGASNKDQVARAFSLLDQEYAEDTSDHPLLLYFTGHGSPDGVNGENNHYDLWGENERLSVRELARHIAHLPSAVPVTVVMVQCFSGSFGNLLFEHGDPNGELVSRDIAGFYATVKDRVAAGCTSAVDEAEYHDFTSYFFAALTGQDRVGRRVTGADYNGDGRIGMDEAFCYTLIHDESIDVPVCTSDVFLRRFVPLEDTRTFRTPYARILEWASPAQRAALEALSNRLHMSGEDRPLVAYQKMFDSLGANHKRDWRQQDQRALNRFNNLTKEARDILTREYPALKMSPSPQLSAARKAAIVQLSREAKEGKWDDLMDATETLAKSDQQNEAQEIADSHLIRFVRLAKSVVLAHQLRQTGLAELKSRFERLLASEARTLLPPTDPLARTASAIGIPR